MARGSDIEPYYVNKWITFAACATLQLTAGLCYCFGIFSCQFKERFQWSQSELTGFGTALNLGAFSAFIPGTLYNALAGFRSGPRICLALAAVQCVGGMFLIWGAATARFTLSYPMLLFAGFICCNSNAAIDVVAVSCNVQNWPQDRGSAVGVMKSAVGLSASIFAVIYAACQLSMEQFLLMCMVVPAIGCVVFLPCINHVPRMQKDELMPHGILSKPARFFMAYQVVFLIAAWSATSSVLLNDGGTPELRTVVKAGLAVLVASLWLVTIHSGGLRSRKLHANVPANFASTAHPQQDNLLSHALLDIPGLAWFRSDSMRDDPDYNEEVMVREYEVDSVGSGDVMTERSRDGDSLLRRPLLQEALYTQRSDRSDSSIAESLYAHGPAKDLAPNKVICTVDFYLLFFVCFVTMGAALALLDNFPQLLRSIAPVAQATEAQAAAGADTAAAAEAAAAAAAATAGGRFWGSISGSASDLLLSESGGGVNGEGGSCGGGGAAGGELAHLGQTLLITFSVCNTLGRIVAGFWSEQALHNHGTPRTFFCVVNSAATAAWTAALFLTISFLSLTQWALMLLVPIAAMAGLTFGASWTLMAVTTSELFGMKYYAVNYATIQFAPMLATAVCPDMLVGWLYDREAERQHPGLVSHNLDCSGGACFRTAFLVLFLLSLIQVLAAILLMWRTRWIYQIESTVMHQMGAVEEHGSEESGPSSPPLSPAPQHRNARTVSNLGSPHPSSPHTSRSHQRARSPSPTRTS